MNSNYRPGLILISFLVLPAPLIASAQEKPHDCSAIRYEHFNQIDPKPLRVSAVRGVVIDETGTRIWNGCVGVFSEDHSRLVASTSLQPDGSFSIPKLPSGDYALIVSSVGFCTANNAIQIRRRIRGRRNLVAKMKVRGIDSCSWIEAR